MIEGHQRLVLRAEALAAGVSDKQLALRAQAGGWTRVGRGAWAVPLDPRPSVPLARSANVLPESPERGPDPCAVRPQALAAALRHRQAVAVAFVDAAAAWGLPRPLPPVPGVALAAAEGRPRANGRTRLVVRPELDDTVPLPGTGTSVSGPLTTVTDCLLALPARDALAVADAALRAGLIKATELAAAMPLLAGRRGAASARAVAALADGRRETALESWSAWAFDRAALPQPRWQVEVVDHAEHRRYRIDCLWGDRLAGEADGRSKALLAAAEFGGASADALARVLDEERRREMRLRALGFEIVRWSARDVLDDTRAARLAELIRARWKLTR